MKKKIMLSFHSDPKLKAAMIKEIKWHMKQDKIIQGVYGDTSDKNSKFCAVGCSINSLNRKLGKNKYRCGDHSVYETALGIPRIIARLEDGIFEGLKKSDMKTFPLEFMQAVPVGADLSMVWPKFLHWLLVDKKHGVIKFAKTESQTRAIQDIADLYQRKINGENIDANKWLEARRAAVYAADAAAADAADAADAAADAADAAAAYAAATADAAADADADADAAAAYAAAAVYARQKARKIQAKKLLELLAEAPIIKS